jgi:ribosomal protein L16/L10AE
MGKGKGSFDHWAARVAVNQVVFEIKGMLHEAVAKDAFRLAGNKLPGESVQASLSARALLTSSSLQVSGNLCTGASRRLLVSRS